MRRAVENSAEVDQNKDGIITVEELLSWGNVKGDGFYKNRVSRKSDGTFDGRATYLKKVAKHIFEPRIEREGHYTFKEGIYENFSPRAQGDLKVPLMPAFLGNRTLELKVENAETLSKAAPLRVELTVLLPGKNPQEKVYHCQLPTPEGKLSQKIELPAMSYCYLDVPKLPKGTQCVGWSCSEKDALLSLSTRTEEVQLNFWKDSQCVLKLATPRK